ncbi:MAG: hypothetical protein V9G18_05465 [Albidovulum sp.]|jgi:hypothetical protein|uniref:hypothetical protein n=1 Tax=Albidovulum sp. TaxID=1872424 RepID=UPI00303C4484
MTALADAPRRAEYHVSRRRGATALSRTLGRLALALLPVAALILAVKLWGLVALGLVALAAVPVAFALLIALTIGK